MQASTELSYLTELVDHTGMSNGRRLHVTWRKLIQAFTILELVVPYDWRSLGCSGGSRPKLSGGPTWGQSVFRAAHITAKHVNT